MDERKLDQRVFFLCTVVPLPVIKAGHQSFRTWWDEDGLFHRRPRPSQKILNAPKFARGLVVSAHTAEQDLVEVEH